MGSLPVVKPSATSTTSTSVTPSVTKALPSTLAAKSNVPIKTRPIASKSGVTGTTGVATRANRLTKPATATPTSLPTATSVKNPSSSGHVLIMQQKFDASNKPAVKNVTSSTNPGPATAPGPGPKNKVNLKR